MLATIADVVHPILRAGLNLHARISAGEMLHRDLEQEQFVELLNALDTAVFFEGDSSDLPPIDDDGPTFTEREQLSQATTRYLLVCWLDELVGTCAQGESWRELPLESLLYTRVAGGAKFWDEARYAEARGDRDALETAYWCVTLGFRGDWQGKPENVEAWLKRVRSVLVQASEPTAMPACLETEPSARQPIFRQSYRPWAFAFYLSLTILIPTIGILCWRHWGSDLW